MSEPQNETPNELESVTLAAIPEMIWTILHAATGDAEAAFRTPVLASMDKEKPDARVVVMRHVDARQRTIECHTDRRSAKARQLSRRFALSWVFYDAHHRLQIRARGTGQVHTGDEFALTRWEALREHQKRQYAWDEPPGQSVAQPPGTENQPDDAVAVGKHNFAVVRSCIDELEWLHLHRSGHRRAISVFRQECWSTHWVMP